MEQIIEIIPDDIPSWAEEAMEKGQLYAELLRRIEELERAENVICMWEYNVLEDCWASNCGDLYTLNDGGPIANGMKYCCFCGKHLGEYSEKLHNTAVHADEANAGGCKHEMGVDGHCVHCNEVIVFDSPHA